MIAHPAAAAQLAPSPLDATLVIEGADVVLQESMAEGCDVVVEGGTIRSLGPVATRAARRIDARGLILAPGLVDLHGDAFERQIQPRPGVDFPLGLALAETDRQLVANGITTAFHGVTLSWEPGLRSRDTFRAWLAELEASRKSLAADHRVQLRLELFAIDAWAEARAAMLAGKVHLVAINDHTEEIARRCAEPIRAARYAERAKVTAAELQELAEAVLSRRAEAETMIAEACRLARALGIPIASHDDASPEARAAWRERGAAICEFPKTRETAAAARAAEEHVVMGCPNIVRGGSHLGWTSAEALLREGLVSVLASDYFYPAMVGAAFALQARGAASLPVAWATMSANPASAAGLADRGRIAAGLRADLVLLEPAGDGAARVVATFVAGRPVFLTATVLERLS